MCSQQNECAVARRKQSHSRRRARRLAWCAALILAGCDGGMNQDPMERAFSTGPKADKALETQLVHEDQTTSPLIAELAARRSVLPAGSPYERVANAILAASPGVEATELGLARLRAKVAASNRLPSFTPVITMDGLAGLAAQLLVDQPLITHGRRKAERERASAEVDLAAVNYSIRQNNRVFEGLLLYLTADQARVQGLVAKSAVERLSALHQIVTGRVEGGLSDRSEEQIVGQTVAEMQATLAGDRRTVEQALAELASITKAENVGDLQGTAALIPLPQIEPLAVLSANAEGTRSLAEARISRAAALPGLSATSKISDGGTVSGLRLGGVQVGPGSPAVVAVANAVPELVAAQIEEVRNSAERHRIELTEKITSLRDLHARGEEVLRRTRENLQLFTDQYSVGERSLTDLTAQTAATARLERDQITLTYEIARLELELARNAGALVDGDSL